MKASARLVAEGRADGSTCLTTLAGQAPLLLRQTRTDDETTAAAELTPTAATATMSRLQSQPVHRIHSLIPTMLAAPR